MATKADFDAQEWSQLREAPALAGIYTLIADQGGAIRESMSIAECYGDARDRWWGPRRDVTLVEEIVAEGPELDRATFGSLPEARSEQVAAQALDRVGSAVAILAAKGSPDEVEDYRRFVLALARRVAEAHKEGSFLGIGGTRVTDKEQAALDEIADALGA